MLQMAAAAVTGQVQKASESTNAEKLQVPALGASASVEGAKPGETGEAKDAPKRF